MSSPDEWYLRELEPFRLEREDLVAVVPEGWDCRIGKRFEDVSGERAFPFLHASTRPLPGQRADFGGGVVERLGTRDVFMSLFEYDGAEAGTALFPLTSTLPVLEVSQFHPNQLQRGIPGQAGVQHFFTFLGRPFCLYVVLGSYANAADLVDKANTMLRGITVQERS